MKTIIYLILIVLTTLNILSQDVAVLYPTPDTRIYPSELLEIRWSNPESRTVSLFYRIDDSEMILISDNLSGDSYTWEVPQSNAQKISFHIIYDDIRKPTLYWHQTEVASSEISSSLFTPSGDYILTTSRKDAVLRLWDFSTREMVHEFSLDFMNEEIYYAVPLSDFTAIVAIGYHIALIDFKETDPLINYINLGSSVRSVDYSPINGGMIAASSSIDGIVYVFDNKLNKINEFKSTLGNEIYTVRFSPDGSSICFASYDGMINCYDLNSSALKLSKKATETSGGTVIWSVDIPNSNKTLASAGVDSKVRIWNDIEAEELVVFENHTQHVRSVKYAPDEWMLISGSLDGWIRLYDPNGLFEYEQIAVDHGSAVISVDFRYDSDYFVSSGRGQDFKVWRVYKPRHFEDSVECVLYREISIYIPHLTVDLNENFILPVLSEYNKDGLIFAKNNYKLNLEIEVPILIVDLDILNEFKFGKQYDTISVSVDFDLTKDTILKMDAFSLLGPTNYDEVRILSVSVDEGLELVTKDGSVNIRKECYGDTERAVLVCGNIPNLTLSPNPAGDFAQLSIDLVESSEYKIVIYDINGKNIISQDLGYHHPGYKVININTSLLQNGSYTLVLKSLNRDYKTRLLISK